MHTHEKQSGVSLGIAYLDGQIDRLQRAAEVETPEPEDGIDRLLRFCRTLRAEFQRRLDGRQGSLHHLYRVKLAMRDGAELLLAARDHSGDEFAGWYSGCTPRNELQGIMNLVSLGLLDLATTIIGIEAEYPQLQSRFDRERAARTLEDQEAEEMAYKDIEVALCESGERLAAGFLLV